MFKKAIIVLSVLLAALLIYSCSDRGTNITRPDYPVRNGFQASITNEGGHLFSEELAISMFSQVRGVPAITYKIYSPTDLENGELPLPGMGPNYPVLYLLSPFRGTNFYYFNHGLAAVADKLTAAGEIDSMLIVCIDGSAGYGATFYGNSWAGGKYTKAIGDREYDAISGSLIDYIDAILATDTSRVNRGISGFEMGGYGAFRIAVTYSENFGSVSAVSSPLDFDGADSTGGFILLFPQIAAGLDLNGDGQVTHQEFKSMDSSYNAPLRTMLMGAACSFSPHVDYDYLVDWGSTPEANDTFYFEDTMTYFNPEGSIEFHLPFDENGNIPDTSVVDSTVDTTIAYIDTTINGIDTLFDTTFAIDTLIDTVGFYDSLWGFWLENNIESMIADGHPDAMDEMNIRLFTVADDPYNFNQQTVDFAEFLEEYLSARGISKELTPLEFGGYEGYPATADRFVYDILPAVLKFHSDIFNTGN